MKIEWNKYESPYLDAIAEIPKQLEYLLSSTDSDEDVELFIYQDLAPNIKHQGENL